MSRRKHDVPSPGVNMHTTSEPGVGRPPTQQPQNAKQALDANLKELTLTRKKSWFGSVRDTFSRSALHAKGVVDQLRGESGGKSYVDDADEYEDRVRGHEDADTISSRNASSAGDSLTPLRPNRAEHQKSLTPRTAVETLRAQLHQSVAKRERKKRGALADLVDSGGSDSCDPPGPENLVDDPLSSVATTKTPVSTIRGHGRKGSVARSLVGSFRTLSRRGTQSTKCASPTKEVPEDGDSPTKQAVTIPLPSSPINIPAPNLNQLDLGPSALMSSSFIHSPELERRSELMALTDPFRHLEQRVPTYYTKIPGEGPSDRPLLSTCTRPAPLTPGDLLELPVDDFGFSAPSEPSTPGMTTPCANLGTDLDGANDHIAVFERSVESKSGASKQENKKLKKMGSIDALADQCARESGSPGTNHLTRPENLREISGQTTISACPSDMPALTKQPHQRIHGTKTSDPWENEDPFAPGKTVGGIGISRLPSPDRSVKLPLRPKIRVQSVDGSQPRTIDISPERMEEEDNIPLALLAHQKAKSRAIPEATGEVEGRLRRREPSVSENLGHLQDRSNETKPIAEDKSSDSTSLFVRTQVQSHQDASDQLPELYTRGGAPDSPVVPSIYRFLSQSQTSSPSRHRPGTTHSPDMGKVFWGQNQETREVDSEWKGPVQQWIHSQVVDAGSPNVQPSPPRSSEQPDMASISIDEVRSTPSPPGDSTPSGTPCIGDEHRGIISGFNTRYNALANISTDQTVVDDDSRIRAEIAASLRPTLKLMTEGNHHHSSDSCAFGVGIPTEGFEDGQIAPSPSRASSYESLFQDSRYPKEPSSDNIDSDPALQEAIQEHYAYQVAMSGLDIYDSPGAIRESAAPSSPFGPFQANVNVAESGYVPRKSCPRPDSVISKCSSTDSKVYTFKVPPEQTTGTVYVDDSAQEPQILSEDPDDTLDDALEMYKNYNASQQGLAATCSFRQRRAQCGNAFESSPSCSENDSDKENVERQDRTTTERSPTEANIAAADSQNSDLSRFERLVDSPGSLRKSRPARYRSRNNINRKS